MGTTVTFTWRSHWCLQTSHSTGQLALLGWNKVGGCRWWDPSPGLQHQLHCSRGEIRIFVFPQLQYGRQNTNCFQRHIIFWQPSQPEQSCPQGETCGHQRSTDRGKIRPFKSMWISSLSFHCWSGKLVMTTAGRGNNASKAQKTSPGAGWFSAPVSTRLTRMFFEDSVRR